MKCQPERSTTLTEDRPRRLHDLLQMDDGVVCFAAGNTAVTVAERRSARCRCRGVRRWRASEPSTSFAVSYSAARFGVNSSGNPLLPVNLSPSSYLSKAPFFHPASIPYLLP